MAAQLPAIRVPEMLARSPFLSQQACRSHTAVRLGTSIQARYVNLTLCCIVRTTMNAETVVGSQWSVVSKNAGEAVCSTAYRPLPTAHCLYYVPM